MKTIQPDQAVGIAMAICVVLLVLVMLLGQSIEDNPHEWYDMTHATPTTGGK